MKIVVNSREVAHFWAHKAQSHARNAGNSVFFRDSTIFSYGSHFPIAQHVTNANGENAILFTTADYSNTTAKHKHVVRRAIPRNATVFNVDLRGFNQPSVEMLDEYNASIKDAQGKAVRARLNKEWHLADIARYHSEAVSFARFFGFDESNIVPLTEDLETLKAAVAAERIRKAAEVKAAKAEAVKRLAEHVIAWRRGDIVHVSFNALDTMLRVVGNEVQTSMGASFPIEHARRGLALVRAVVARGEEWRTNGHTCHLGHYAIDKITASGTVYAGCHVVKLAEIERIAPQLEA